MKHLLVLIGILFASNSWSSFHLWDISEVFSSADGTIQFIEIETSFGGQGVILNRTLSANSDGNNVVFTILNNVSSSTANKKLLFATSGFSSLPGAITPDFIIPDNFFNPNSANININFAAVDTIDINGELPTDGILSLNASLVQVINTPTNFADDTGEIDLSGMIFKNSFED